MDFIIDKMKDKDWPQVASIYQEGIDTGNATFETEAPDWNQWDKDHLRNCRLVAKARDQIVGWAALSPVSSKHFYSGVAENSVYINSSARGSGIGKALLDAIVKESERVGIWTVQSRIFSNNTASIAMNKACGFREVGYRERIGQLNGTWKDVVLLERRSKIVGVFLKNIYGRGINYE